jgi:hypothetical protein
MTTSRARRRNRTIAAAVSGLLVLGAAPTIGLVGWHVLKNSKEGTTAKVYKTVGFPSTPTAMIAVVDDQKLITALAVLVLAPGTGKGGTLVSFPTDASTGQTADEQQYPIADSVIRNGPDVAAQDVASLSRVSIGSPGVLDRQALATLLAPLPSLSVTLPDPLVDAAADGTKQTLFPAGPQQMTPAQAAGALAAADPTVPEAKRLPDVHAMWSALAAGVGTGINSAGVAPVGPNGPTDFNDFMAHFLAGPVQVFNDVTTVPITGPTNPGKVDVGRVDVPSVVLLMASLAPSAMITPNATLNFRIENGVTQADIDAAGLVGVTPTQVTLDLVQRLLFAEGNIVSVSPEVFTLTPKNVPDVTTIFAEGGVQSAELAVITNQLGTSQVQDPKFVFPLVNVTIVVGRSYLTDMASRRATTASSAASTAASTAASSAGSSTVVGDIVTTDAKGSASTVSS